MIIIIAASPLLIPAIAIGGHGISFIINPPVLHKRPQSINKKIALLRLIFTPIMLVSTLIFIKNYLKEIISYSV